MESNLGPVTRHPFTVVVARCGNIIPQTIHEIAQHDIIDIALAWGNEQRCLQQTLVQVWKALKKPLRWSQIPGMVHLDEQGALEIQLAVHQDLDTKTTEDKEYGIKNGQAHSEPSYAVFTAKHRDMYQMPLPAPVARQVIQNVSTSSMFGLRFSQFAKHTCLKHRGVVKVKTRNCSEQCVWNREVYLKDLFIIPLIPWSKPVLDYKW